MQVVTFSCSEHIHVYLTGCYYKPLPPYESHTSVKQAVLKIGNDTKVIIHAKDKIHTVRNIKFK